MNNLEKTLEREQTTASSYLEAARAKSDQLEAAYWLGYLEATTNAAALIYGPTPLDSEGN